MRMAESDENLSGKLKVPSEKHDVLFSKARYVLNQRHIKRPWFNLNPFLEKTDENIDLENFLPGESKYIQPLESLVLCESFHNDNPVDTREISIDAFFEYLFSSEWDKGCSIRILEGQLLDQLLLGLYRLENEGVAVRHTTYAFAKNNRLRTGCYKLSKKGSAGSVEETLLIEFAHFGRLIKEKPNENTLNAFEYLEQDEVDVEEIEDEATHSGEAMPILPILNEMSSKRRDTAMSISNKSTASDIPKWGRQGSLMSKHINAITFLKAIQTDNKRQSITPQCTPPQNKRLAAQTTSRPKCMPGLVPLHESRRQTITGSSFESANRRRSLAVSQSPMAKSQQPFRLIQRRKESIIQQRQEDNADLKSQASIFKTKYRGRINSIDFDDDVISEPGDINEEIEEDEPLKKRDEFFGEEFYLSDQRGNYKNYKKGIKQILQQKKKDLHEHREEAKRQREEKAKSEKICRLPELPKLTSEDLDAFRMHNETIKMPDELPTLEEFINLLKTDEYYDPRYKNKVRLKSKKIAQRYYIAKGMHRSSIMFNMGCVPAEIRNINTFRRGSCKKSTASVKQKEIAECKSKGHISRTLLPQESDRLRKDTGNLTDIKGSHSVESILEHGQEVFGVTDSEPCKDHFIKGKMPSLMEKKDDREDSVPTVPSLRSPMFPKIQSPSENDIESSDTDSNESSCSEEKSEESFDTKKLNLKYSVERLRKKRRSKVKKKGGFIEVLAKYYNMQNAINVFNKKNSVRNIKKGRLRAKAFGIKKLKEKEEEGEEPVIGKLRKFKFQDVRNKKKMNLDNIPTADFSVPKLEVFQQQLSDSLDKFVVRREVVVTDQTTFYNATTSVTFTKVSCFHHKQRYMPC